MEDHKYELLLSTQTEVPQSAQDPPSQKCTGNNTLTVGQGV